MSNFRRRLRGAVRNVVVWGVGWSVLGFGANLVMRMTGLIDAPVSVPEAVQTGLKIGLGGAIAGAAFSAFIAFAYRDRGLLGISCLKFGAGGAAVTALSIVGFVQAASLLGGGGLVPWEYLNPTLFLFAGFGFGVASGSMKLAQMATLKAAGDSSTLSNVERLPQLASKR